jgi:hypothetical protein
LARIHGGVLVIDAGNPLARFIAAAVINAQDMQRHTREESQR